jgi:hypothetical protein
MSSQLRLPPISFVRELRLRPNLLFRTCPDVKQLTTDRVVDLLDRLNDTRQHAHSHLILNYDRMKVFIDRPAKCTVLQERNCVYHIFQTREKFP